MTDPAARQVARRFCEFALLRELGRGSTGVVWLARQERLGRDVALKLLAPHCASDAACRARFAAAARAQAAVHHPALCPVLEVGELEESPYLVMPFLGDATLADRIAGWRARGRPPSRAELDQVLELLSDVGGGLDALHRAGLVHGDVKPANVLIADGGRGVLIDFGLLQPTARCASTFGTPAYLAPELVRGSDASPASDVYALAVTAFESATLRLPFESSSREGLYRRIVEGEALRARLCNRAVPPALDVVLAAGMERDRARRIGTARAFADDLLRVRRGAPIVARRLPVHVRIARFVHDHRLPSALAGLLLLSVPLLLGMTDAASAARLAAAHATERAERTLRPVDLLASREELRAARGAAADLVPPWPHRHGDLVDWTSRHGPLLLLADEVARQRDLLRDGAIAADDALAEWFDGALQGFAGELDDFRRSVWCRMQHRTAWAARLASLENGPLADAWRRAIEEIRTSPAYRGLRIVPQPGLVPLGPDPVSGLHEFYEPAAAGDGPMLLARDHRGQLIRDPRQGIVYVLLPGGEALDGAQGVDPAAPHYDPGGAVWPLQTVQLEPFLISKYELTRGQWSVLCGRPAPSGWTFRALGHAHADDPALSMQPVHLVSWDECDAALREIGACLPTAAQWEYACRAGTTMRHFAGDEPAALAGYANAQERPDLDLGARAPIDVFDDGFPLTAPVGSLRPNPWGLHDMLGNVAEWCRDLAGPQSGTPARPGDGLREPEGRWSERLVRGRAYSDRAHLLRSADGIGRPSGVRRLDIGCRPARRLWPWSGTAR